MALKERKIGQTRPSEENEREYLESRIRSDYERCHANETLEDLKRQSRFSKEDKGLLRDWMVLAARRATAKRYENMAA
jgi:hypothetical protein